MESVNRYGWPSWVVDLFPMTAIFYRPKRPKQRKKVVGFDLTVAPSGKRVYKKRYGKYKKASTRDQNNFSYVTCCLPAPDDFGTARRSLKHKGYPMLIAMVYSTPEEIARAKACSRYVFYKYKSLGEIFRRRGVYSPEMADLFERLDVAHPTKSTGQLRLW